MTETVERVQVRFLRGPLWDFLHDDTRHIDLEGAIRSGKTTAALWKVLLRALQDDGMQWLVCRYSDGDTRTKLRPRLEELMVEAGVSYHWDPHELCYRFPNRSKIYAFGLKAQDQLARYAKLRGMTLGGIYVDQAEELPHDLYQELVGRLSQPGYRHQLILTPNPPPEDSWLSVEFPAHNPHPHHRYYCVSIYENAHNLDADTIQSIEAAYPIGHAKHGPYVLGTRGVNVAGFPVYGALDPKQPETAAFQRARHERPIALDPDLALYESLDFGKHHPCVVWAQYTRWGGLHVLGGILGMHLYLEDFAPLVQQYRQRWFGDRLEVVTCCDPAGSHDNSQGLRDNGVALLKRLGFAPLVKQDSNTPDVRLAMIERLAGHMRRRDPMGEAFGVASDARWVRAAVTGMVPHRFVADALEAGYVWDQHFISVGNKPVRKPKKDGWFEHGMNCFSDDTDVLTETGWRRFASLTGDEALGTVRLADDQLEYQRPSRLIAREWDAPMLRFGGRLDALVTPNHRMVVFPWTGEWEERTPTFCEATSVRKSHRVKLTVGQWQGASPDAVELEGTYSAPHRQIDVEDWAEFLGWYLAEGSVNHCVRVPGHGYAVCVSQMPGPKRVLLEALLHRMPWRWQSRPSGLQASSKQLWMALEPLGNSHTKRVPSWIRASTPAVIRRFLVGAVLGDGHVTKTGAQGYFTISPGLADDIQELFLKLGMATRLRRVAAKPYHIRGRSGSNTHPQYHVWTRSSTDALLRSGDGSSQIREEPYRGMVYCATVPNSTLVVRRNGRPFVAGNCLEYLEHHFGGVQPSAESLTRHAARVRGREGAAVERARPVDEMEARYDRMVARATGGRRRGGY